MAVVEVETALSLAFARIFLGETCIRRGQGSTPLQNVHIRAVRRCEMVVVQAVLKLQLPVRVERIGYFSRYDLNLPCWTLIDDEIEKRFRLPQIVIKRRNVGRKTGKHEAAIAVKPRHANQIVIGIIKARGILTGCAFRNGRIATAAIVRPAMIAANMQFLVSTSKGADQRAAVPASVEEAVYFTGFVAGN